MATLGLKTILIISITGLAHAANAGVIIKSQYNKKTETTIYQNGVAIFLEDGFANFIVDTHTNKCTAINHELKTYLFVSCAKFQEVVKILNNNNKVEFNAKMPIAIQEFLPENETLKINISIKHSGAENYQGNKLDKFQFIVGSQVVSEYWMSDKLQKKIEREVDIKKLNKIFNVSHKTNFNNSLNAKIKKKYNEFKKGRIAVKEFRYTGAKTKKLFKDITFKRVALKEYMPPKSYKVSSTVSGFFNVAQ
ncbi:hypothetical protein MNBD_GAMMA22-155 [hydrothermal vent metagenome]|uniref:DUF4412 domain-containing protein n=1 Tax=hydrothermal vent metagenome TaxID=652676 RepID=A0A3B1B9T9_9ZZZZ